MFGSLTENILVCLDRYGLARSYLRVHQALPPIPLSPPLPRQSEMAPHCLVGQPHIHNPVGFRLHGLLPLPMFACWMVLDALL